MKSLVLMRQRVFKVRFAECKYMRQTLPMGDYHRLFNASLPGDKGPLYNLGRIMNIGSNGFSYTLS